MNGTELRLGNIVMTGQHLAIVGDITASGITYDSLDGEVVAEFCEWEFVWPVELTEHWLKRFGFFTGAVNKVHKKYNEQGNIFQLNRVGDNYEFVWGGKSVKYVNELQNLYYALTGIELTSPK